MTLLGLAAMVFYAVMLATGVVGIDVMPQFVVSAVIFLSSGRLMRMAARKLPPKEVDEEEEEKKKQAKSTTDWEWLTQFLNWAMVLIILSGLALWVMKPVGVSLVDAIKQYQPESHPYYSDQIP